MFAKRRERFVLGTILDAIQQRQDDCLQWQKYVNYFSISATCTQQRKGGYTYFSSLLLFVPSLFAQFLGCLQLPLSLPAM